MGLRESAEHSIKPVLIIAGPTFFRRNTPLSSINIFLEASKRKLFLFEINREFYIKCV